MKVSLQKVSILKILKIFHLIQRGKPLLASWNSKLVASSNFAVALSQHKIYFCDVLFCLEMILSPRVRIDFPYNLWDESKGSKVWKWNLLISQKYLDFSKVVES